MARGLCAGHYHQRRRGLELRPLRSRRKQRPSHLDGVALAVWMLSQTRDEGGCQVWRGYCTPDGYPEIRVGGRNWLGARFILATLRPRPEGWRSMMALHSTGCVSRACINPDHLRWGGAEENVADAIEVGSHPLGNLRGGGDRALSDDEVREIRRRVAGGESATSLAAKYGVGPSTAWRAARGLGAYSLVGDE